MKYLKRFFSLVLMVAVTCAFAGCGKNADSKYVGKYTAMCGESLGIIMTAENMDGFSLDLKSDGKADVVIDGESYSADWSNDDESVTLKIDGEYVAGEIGEDTIKFIDMLGIGIDVTFAKEGTAATNPENYLPEEEKAVIGTWVSKAVTDISGEPTEDFAQDALTLEINSDHSATLKCGDVDHGSASWSLYSGLGTFEGFLNVSDSDSITFVAENGNVTVIYSVGGNSCKFICEKQ